MSAPPNILSLMYRFPKIAINNIVRSVGMGGSSILNLSNTETVSLAENFIVKDPSNTDTYLRCDSIKSQLNHPLVVEIKAPQVNLMNSIIYDEQKDDDITCTVVGDYVMQHDNVSGDLSFINVAKSQ